MIVPLEFPVAVFCVVSFAWLTDRLRLLGFAHQALAISKQASAVLLDATADETRKEIAARQAAVKLLAVTVQLVLRLFIAVALPGAVATAMVWQAWLTEQALADALLSWYIIGFTVIVFVWQMARKR